MYTVTAWPPNPNLTISSPSASASNRPHGKLRTEDDGRMPDTSDIPDSGRQAHRHWVLPQETAYRRWTAHMLARRTGPNPQREAFEKLFGPDGVVYFEAGAGDMASAAVTLLAAVVVTITGLPYQVGNWFLLATMLSALIALARFWLALRAGRAFRGGERIIRFRKPRR
jgi:hypothetical protein